MAWKALLLVIFASLVLVACSSSAPQEPPAAAQNSAESSAAETSSSIDNGDPSEPLNPRAVTVDPVIETLPAASDSPNIARPQGGKLTILGSDPPTLDPHLTTDNVSGRYVNEIFGGLVTLGLDLQVAPDLAESWDVSEDGTVYTFHLREDAKFHNGRSVTAEDVRWSLERVSDRSTLSPVADQYLSDIVGFADKLNGQADSISGLKVIDERTVEITIDAPKSYFLAKLTYPTGFILDKENVEGEGDSWLRAPNGTGPFRLEEYSIGELIRLTRNENYHLGPPNLDEVEFLLAGGSAMLMYENDEIHLTGVPQDEVDRVLDPSEPLNADVQTLPFSFSVSYIGLNVNEEPFNDPYLRQALNFAFDRNLIAEVIMEGQARPAMTIIPPGFPSHNSEIPGYEFDPDRARDLFNQSRYGGDPSRLPRITLSTVGSFGARVSPSTEAILSSWEQELGIAIEIQQTEWATFLEDLHDRKYQMFILAWGADYADPQNFLDILFHSESENNHTNYSSPQVDAILEQARVEQDTETRYQLYNQAEEMILADAPWVLLWNSGENYALIKPEVKGYELTPMTIPKLRHVYFEQQ